MTKKKRFGRLQNMKEEKNIKVKWRMSKLQSKMEVEAGVGPFDAQAWMPPWHKLGAHPVLV